MKRKRVQNSKHSKNPVTWPPRNRRPGDAAHPHRPQRSLGADHFSPALNDICVFPELRVTPLTPKPVALTPVEPTTFGQTTASPYRVLFLGTGGAITGKIRDVSGSLLVAGGDGTAHQLLKAGVAATTSRWSS